MPSRLREFFGLAAFYVLATLFFGGSLALAGVAGFRDGNWGGAILLLSLYASAGLILRLFRYKPPGARR